MLREVARQELEVQIQQGLDQLFLDIDATTGADPEQEQFRLSFSKGKVVVRRR